MQMSINDTWQNILKMLTHLNIGIIILIESFKSLRKLLLFQLTTK